jgi:hypothetical protein
VNPAALSWSTTRVASSELFTVQNMACAMIVSSEILVG